MSVVTIEVEGVEHELNPDKDVEIDPDNINDEFVRLPSLLNDYGILLELAQGEVDSTKFDLERIYAQEDYKVREEAKQSGMKITETMVANQVKTSKRYQQCYADYLDQRRNVGMLKSMLNALKSKQECLISIGANMRSEGFGTRLMKSVDADTRKDIRENKKERAKRLLRQSKKKSRSKKRKRRVKRDN